MFELIDSLATVCHSVETREATSGSSTPRACGSSWRRIAEVWPCLTRVIVTEIPRRGSLRPDRGKFRSICGVSSVGERLRASSGRSGCRERANAHDEDDSSYGSRQRATPCPTRVSSAIRRVVTSIEIHSIHIRIIYSIVTRTNRPFTRDLTTRDRRAFLFPSHRAENRPVRKKKNNSSSI